MKQKHRLRVYEHVSFPTVTSQSLLLLLRMGKGIDAKTYWSLGRGSDIRIPFRETKKACYDRLTDKQTARPTYRTKESRARNKKIVLDIQLNLVIM